MSTKKRDNKHTPNTEGYPMKFAVTPELATLIKTMRTQNALSAKDLAEHLRKSPSYISKLEGGEVKSIQKDTLTDLLMFVGGSKSFFDEILPAALRSLRSFMEPSRIVAQVWLIQYDTVDRMVRIPDGMADDIAHQLDELGISITQLVETANRNIDSEMTANFPANQIVCIDYDGRPRIMVRVELDLKTVKSAFSSAHTPIPYLHANTLLFTMYRLINHPNASGKLPAEDAAATLRCTASYMERWGLHSLTSFARLVSSDKFIAQQAPLVFENESVVDRVHEQVSDIAQLDAISAANQLNIFSDTLSWDPAFALKLVGIPFSDLGQLSFSAKKRLLDDIQALIDRYDALPDLEKKLENY